MFTEKIEPIISNGVTTICGKDLIPKGIGKFSWYCNDDEGKLHTNIFNTVLYPPYSPVNIIIATAPSESMKDYEETWVLTKRKYSIFT